MTSHWRHMGLVSTAFTPGFFNAIVSAFSPRITASPSLPGASDAVEALDRRQYTTIEMSTCGYENGDPDKIRTANPGYDCRVDTLNNVWGFCPTTVISATDCGLAVACKDGGTCSSVCGNTLNSALTTFTCSTGSTAYCSTALLTFGVDQTYAYIGCAAEPSTAHLLVTPTTSSSSSSFSTSIASSSSKAITSTIGELLSSAAATESRQISTSLSASPTNTSEPPSNSSNDTGSRIGGVIGGLALVCISGLGALYLLRRYRRGKPDNPPFHPRNQDYDQGLTALYTCENSKGNDSVLGEPPNYRYQGEPAELPSNNESIRHHI